MEDRIMTDYTEQQHSLIVRLAKEQERENICALPLRTKQ